MSIFCDLRMSNIDKLPNELLEHIFYNVDQDSLRSQCINVSIRWKKTIQSVPFWKRYHRYWGNWRSQKHMCSLLIDKSTPFSEDNHPDYDWMFYSHVNPKRNPFEINLLKNSDGNIVSPEELHAQDNRYYEDGYTKPWPTYPYWDIFSSGGKGWKVLKLPEIKIGVKNHERLISNPPSACFVASYHSCTMSQTIDIVKDYEVSREILHDPRYEFDIDVIEWHIMKGPCRYDLKISFRDERNRVIHEVECDSKYSNEFENGTWAKCHRTVTICGIRKLRFITFYHGATCNEPVPTREDNVQAAIDDWADVGTKMTGGSIYLSYPKMTRLTKDEQLYSNRYVRHPKFSDGKTWYTVDSFGPLGNNKFSSGTYPITASVN